MIVLYDYLYDVDNTLFSVIKIFHTKGQTLFYIPQLQDWPTGSFEMWL